VSTTTVHKDPENLTMTVVTDLDATVERAWELWADPRQLEQWWGPPGYPATFAEHDLTPGARCTYFMTSPEGDTHWGWWEIVAVDGPGRLELRDGFASEGGTPAADMPEGRMVITLTPHGAGTRMTVENHFPSAEMMEQLIAMGHEDGMVAAASQIDAVLAGEFAPR
jgi:uncharacterized protein YndB with AHSA1/START domain